jgi:hypothetical protein
VNPDTRESTPEVKPVNKLLGQAAKWFAALAAVVSLLGLALALLGYGVSLAAEAVFGMPHSVIFDSSFELIDLASVALAQMGARSIRLLLDIDTLLAIYRLTWPVLLLMAAVVAGMLWVLSPKVIQWLTSRKTTKLATPAQAPRMSPHWRFGLGLLAVIPGVPLVMMLMLAVMTIVFVLLSFIPMMGVVAGTAYIDEWVLQPGQCFPLVNLPERLRAPKPDEGRSSTKVTHCIAVVKDGRALARGRVVFMSAKAAILFDPADGTVRKVPIADAVVEVLPAL